MSHVSYESLPTGRVTGDWLPDDHPGYPARIAGLWNGWAEPLVTEEVAVRIVEDQEAMRLELDEASRLETERLEYDFDRHAVVSYMDAETPPQCVVHEARQVGDSEEPLINVGFGWTWSVVDDDALPKPSAVQLEVIRALKRYWDRPDEELATYSVRVLADGTAVIPVMVQGEPTEIDGRQIGTRVTKANVSIGPDGEITEEDV